MKVLAKYFAISLGAFLGGGLRFVIESLAPKSTGSVLGVLLVNACACFIIGIATGLFLRHFTNDFWNKFLVSGFCGSLSTFSSFSAGLYMLLEKAGALETIGFIIIHFLITLIIVYLGLWISMGRQWKSLLLK